MLLVSILFMFVILREIYFLLQIIRYMAKQYLKNFYLKDYLLITLGLALYSVGLVAFILPGKLVVGGGIGIATLIEYATGIPLQYTNFALNGILLIVSYRILGAKFLVKTVYGVGMLTLFIILARMVFQEPIIEEEPTISGLIGGMMCGAGVGLVFSNGGSTGGMDIVIAIINKFKNITFGRIMLFFDFIIISSSFLIFQDYKIIVVSLFVLGVTTYTIDMVINGSRQSVQVMVFSKEYIKIATSINLEMNRGCTVLDGTGWYSQTPTKVIIVLVKQSEADEIFRLIKTIDPDAFITQSNVRGVYGKGFEVMR